jgi:hypothetical protein
MTNPTIDEHHGIGGSYEIVDGVRKLISRTADSEVVKTEPAQLVPGTTKKAKG